MTQMDLWADETYVDDQWIVGHNRPNVRHPDSVSAQMRKPFIFWDGEGYTDERGSHHYWLLANSVGDKIIAPPGRSLERHNIARVFQSVNARIGDAIHCGFALGYDFTCILRGNGLTDAQHDSLYRENILRTDGYVFRLRMGKQLESWINGQNSKGSKFCLQDSWGFFQRSFVKAMDEYFGTGWKYRDIVMEMKAQRGSFDREHDDEVMRYNDYELKLGVELMEELRDRLYQGGMPITKWYGPGALANGLLSNWRIKDTLVDYYNDNHELSRASQYAYAGGRFELFTPGHSKAPVFQYDINSAYPYAIAQLPNLARGTWEHIENPSLTDLEEFSIIRVDMDSALAEWELGMPKTMRSMSQLYPEAIPFPFWHRSKHGSISYPGYGISGWYYAPEVFAAIEYLNSLPEWYRFTVDLREAWVFRPENPMYYYTLNESRIWTNRTFHTDFSMWDKLQPWTKEDILPFYRVPELYRQRQLLKRHNNGAHIGIKLGLNSLYGKFAQQIGYDEKTGRIPPYHNLVLAGWVTSMCRAMILRAMMQNPGAIIACETDGLFSIAELDLPIGDGLGMWERTEYDDMHYYASGFRFGIRNGEIHKPATRGIPARDISLDRIQREIRNSQNSLTVIQTQFITLNWAAAMNRQSETGQWRELEKELMLMCEDATGKRIHDWQCPNCIPGKEGYREYVDGLHMTMPNTTHAYQLSEPHKIVWQDNGSGNSRDDIEPLFEI